MFGLNMTPPNQPTSTDSFLNRPHVAWDAMWIEHARTLERELAAATAECLEQARLLGMSGEREADLLAKLARAEKALSILEQRYNNNMKIVPLTEHISSYRTGSIVGIKPEQVTAILGIDPITEKSGDGKVTIEWRFKANHSACAIWDYKGSLKWDTLSVFMPAGVGKKLFGDAYKNESKYS